MMLEMVTGDPGPGAPNPRPRSGKSREVRLLEGRVSCRGGADYASSAQIAPWLSAIRFGAMAPAAARGMPQ
jgi:hypothetical protein